ncbi:Basic phospholipase A2 notechis 11'2 [Dirofilaria immitis]
MCCMKHDFCYDKAVGEGDCYDTAEEYLLPYNWKCIQNQSVCLNNANSKCGCAICACDSAIIKCWSRFEKPKIKVKSFNFLFIINPYSFGCTSVKPSFSLYFKIRTNSTILMNNPKKAKRLHFDVIPRSTDKSEYYKLIALN